MAQICPSALPPKRISNIPKPANLELITENDYTLNHMRKRGLLHAAKKGKLSSHHNSCVLTRSSQQSLKTLKSFVHKNLKGLSIYFYSLSTSDIKFLQHYIPNLSALKNLQIKVRSGERADDRLFAKLSRSISKLHALKAVNIGFIESSSITNFGVTTFFRYMSYITGLQSLQYRIFECPTLNSETLVKATSYLTRFNHIETIGLDFSNCCEIQNEGLSGLGAILSRVDNLKALRLQLKGCYSLSDEGITYFGSFLRMMDKLKGLEINLESCFDITEKGLTQLGRDISLLRGLKSLNISTLDGPEISNNGLEMLGEAISNLVDLKKFEFCLGSWQYGNRICDDGISKFAELIAQLRILNILKIKLWSLKDFSDEGLENLGNSLNEMAGLQKVILQFGKCRGVSRRGVSQLEKTLSLNKRISEIDVKSH